MGCVSLALLGFGHPEISPWLAWLSASHKSLSSLLGRSRADCLDLPRIALTPGSAPNVFLLRSLFPF